MDINECAQHSNPNNILYCGQHWSILPCLSRVAAHFAFPTLTFILEWNHAGWLMTGHFCSPENTFFLSRFVFCWWSDHLLGSCAADWAENLGAWRLSAINLRPNWWSKPYERRLEVDSSLFMELSEGDDSNRIGEIISGDVVKLLCGKAHNAQQLVIACTSRSKKILLT